MKKLVFACLLCWGLFFTYGVKAHETGEVVKDANGNRKRFKIGQDMDNLDSDGLSSNITELLKTLEEYNIEIPSSLYEETSTSTDGSINTSGY